MRRLCISLFITASLGGGLAAAPDEETAVTRQVMNNLSHEHIECASYYVLVSVCLKNRGGFDALAKDYENHVSVMLERGLMLNERANNLPETFIARMEIASADHKKAIANSCSNISILSARYGNSCKALAEDFKKRGEELFNADMAKQSKKGSKRK